MGEIVVVKEPEWKIFNVAGDPDRFRGILQMVYENLLPNNHDYIPDLEHILGEEDSIELDIIQPIMQLITFGEEKEDLTDSEEDSMYMNLDLRHEDIAHDIKLSFLSDQYFFIDEFGQFINKPIITIW